MKAFKRTISLLLAVLMVASASVIIASAVSRTDYRTDTITCIQRDDKCNPVIDPATGQPQEIEITQKYGTRPVISDVVNSDPNIQIQTRRYRFYMPDSWRNELNDNYDGNSLDSCCPCVYWWSTSYNSDDYKGECTQGWPGFRILEQDPDDPNIFVCDIPEDAHTIIFNNSVDDGQTHVDNPNYGYNYQTSDISTSYTDPEDDDYRFYTTTKDGQAISPENPMTFEDMIYVIDPNNTTISDLSGAPMVHGEWLYYYGDGEYGTTPEQGDIIFKNGEFPSNLQISDTNITFYKNDDPKYTVFCTAEKENLNVYSEDTNLATVSEVSAVTAGDRVPDMYKSKVEINAIADGETKVIFEETVTDDLGNEHKNTRTCNVNIYYDDTTIETDSRHIYFDTSGWKSFEKVYCHVWEIGGDSFFRWQVPVEECEKVKRTIYSYDLSKLADSVYVPGGMKPGGKYGVIFSTNTGLQTYDLTIGTECNGDIARLTGKQVENPVDSNKKGYEVVWTNNSDKYGPHLALSSIGNVIGSKLAPGEKGIQVIGDWVPTYYNSPNVDAVDALAKAYPVFGIKTISDLTNVYSYILTKDVPKSDLNNIKRVLEQAFYKAYPDLKPGEIEEKNNDISNWKVYGITNKTYTGKAITQKDIIVTNGSEIASVKIQYTNNKNAGIATIVISGTGKYTGTIVKTFKINKANNPMTVKTKAITAKVKSDTSFAKAKAFTVTKAQGTVTFKKASGDKKVTITKTGKITVKKGLKKSKTYSLKVKVTAAGTKNYKSVSKTVTVKIKVK